VFFFDSKRETKAINDNQNDKRVVTRMSSSNKPIKKIELMKQGRFRNDVVVRSVFIVTLVWIVIVDMVRNVNHNHNNNNNNNHNTIRRGFLPMIPVMMVEAEDLNGGTCSSDKNDETCRGTSTTTTTTTTTTAPKSSECQDEHIESSCFSWAAAGECDKNPTYMHRKCRKSCGLCGTNNRR
jgi:hypothetical protein